MKNKIKKLLTTHLQTNKLTTNQLTRRGQSLVELLLVIGLISVVLPALFVGFFTAREGKAQQSQRLLAIPLLKDAEEAARVVREAGWSSFALNGTYHPVASGNTWSLVAGSEIIGDFTRTMVISDVERNASGAIVTTGGTVDPSTKKVVTTVSWTLPFPSSVTSTLYLTRWQESATYTETTEDQFNYEGSTNPGLQTGVTVRATTPSGVLGDGEIILGAGGTGDWCTPFDNIVAEHDLPKSGVANAVSAYEGRAVAGTGENASGVSFADLSISNSNPPVVTQNATFNGYKTNDVFVSETYGYIATDTNAKEVVILDLATSPITEVGSFDASGPTDATSIFVSGNRGYLTQGTTLYVIDLSSKTGARPQIGPALALGGIGQKLVVVGNYAYVALSTSLIKLQIIDISDPTDPSKFKVVGQLTLSVEAARDLYVNTNGTRTYLATGHSSTLNEFFIIDTSVKTLSLPVVGSYNSTGMDPYGVAVVPGNRAILGGIGAEEYQVINISDEDSPLRCGGMDISTGINDLASIPEADGDAYSYIVTGDASAELKVLQGGPGGAYASSGTFESQTFDPGYQTANNRFSAQFSEPSGTSLEFQVGMANLVSGSCPTTGDYTFVGPDGTSDTRFSQASGEYVTFPFASYLNYSNPGQCIRYKAYFTGDGSSTPVLNEVTINYSP